MLFKRSSKNGFVKPFFKVLMLDRSVFSFFFIAHDLVFIKVAKTQLKS